MIGDTFEVDLTLVINIHGGGRFMNRTMISLEEAARYAASFGIRCELLLIMDRSPPETLSWVRSYDSGGFDTLKSIEVDNGSLGLSRNAGLRAARGEIVFFADEDDLISFNMLSESYFLAKSSGPQAVVIPEYFMGFSDDAFLVRYFGSGVYSPLSFITMHPFNSRIMVHKSVRTLAEFSDVPPNTNYAYEDWQFNTKLAALGYRFIVAPSTIVFYRVHGDSLQRKMAAETTKLIPPTPLFEPLNYLRTCSPDFAILSDLIEAQKKKHGSEASFFSSAVCAELTKAANTIDPGIDPIRVQWSGTKLTNLGISLARGAAYFRACQIIEALKFTDVVLLSAMEVSDAERYVLSIVEALGQIGDSKYVLVLRDNRSSFNKMANLKNAIFVDVAALGNQLDEDDIDIITLRLIEATAPTARLHLTRSGYAHRFVTKFSVLLSDNKMIYYRFANRVLRVGKHDFIQGDEFNFLSENIERLALVLVDHEGLKKQDNLLLDQYREKWSCIYACVEPNSGGNNVGTKEIRRKLLWSSDLGLEEQCHILKRLTERLSALVPGLEIDVLKRPGTQLSARDREYGGVRELAPQTQNAMLQRYQDYDGLLYATSCEGLPQIILEAMCAGLPVVAPDIVGINEAVIEGSTGILLRKASGLQMVDLFCQSIVDLYSDYDKLERMGRNAIRHVEANHSESAFLNRIERVFQSKMLKKIG